MPQEQLNVIALISGGKDSLFTIAHCLKQGHNVVALANLHPSPPPQGEEDSTSVMKKRRADLQDKALKDDRASSFDLSSNEDLNSFMYQTVGHTVVPLYADALDLPLFRGEIKGTQNVAGKEYHAGSADSSSPDETESLIPLLKCVMDVHPEANSLCAGAILSDYQRTRVESVAIRLGLIPLAWLWRYPSLPSPWMGHVKSHDEITNENPESQASPGSLLLHMGSCGQESRIIKIASGGLDETHLWLNVTSRVGLNRIVRAMGRFADERSVDGGAPLGEGGEYETLALDGPQELWKKRIEIDRYDLVRESGGIAYLIPIQAKTVPKASHSSLKTLSVPGLLDPTFLRVLSAVKRTNISFGRALTFKSSQHPGFDTPLFMSNMIGAGMDVEAQTISIVQQIWARLDILSRAPEDIVFTAIYLKDLSTFTTVNNIYGTLFSRPLPAARMTIGLATLPSNVQIMMSCTLSSLHCTRRGGLHVQSRSYWAPANIGPYAQAIAVDHIVYTAGQIPLIPSTMNLPTELEMRSYGSDERLFRSILSIQHLWRVGQVMRVDHWAGGTCFMCGEDLETRARVATQVWRAAHDSQEVVESKQEDVDVWDMQNLRRDVGSLDFKAHRLPSPTASHIPPLIVVEVDELPRGADVEWTGLGLSGPFVFEEAGWCYSGVSTTNDEVQRTIVAYVPVPNGELKSVLTTLEHSVIPPGKVTWTEVVIYTSSQDIIPALWQRYAVPVRSVWIDASGVNAAAVLKGNIS